MSLKATIKRGALVAAANWQVTLIQAVADSLFKMLIAVPILGGALIGALVIGAEPGGLLSLEWRELLATIVSALLSQPFVLASFLSALAVVTVGGSYLMFLIKGGTVATLVAGEQAAGVIEDAPLRLSTVAAAMKFSADSFIAACGSFFPRYARLGTLLMAVYLFSGAVYLASVLVNLTEGWGGAALTTTAFVAWITIVNFLYLLTQIVMAADDCGVGAAMRRVVVLLRGDGRRIASVFGVVLAIVVVTTGVSLLATAALGLIAFVPLFGLTVLPLQILAWVLRGVVFQYIGLTSVGAYVSLYRTAAVDRGSWVVDGAVHVNRAT